MTYCHGYHLEHHPACLFCACPEHASSRRKDIVNRVQHRCGRGHRARGRSTRITSSTVSHSRFTTRLHCSILWSISSCRQGSRWLKWTTTAASAPPQRTAEAVKCIQHTSLGKEYLRVDNVGAVAQGQQSGGQCTNANHGRKDESVGEAQGAAVPHLRSFSCGR